MFYLLQVYRSEGMKRLYKQGWYEADSPPTYVTLSDGFVWVVLQVFNSRETITSQKRL